MSTITAFCILVFVIAILCWMAVTLDRQAKRAEARVEQVVRDKNEIQKRLTNTENQSLDLVNKVTPLVEKTDWMTGRWGGQFDTLVAMENKRNLRVEEARKAIWAIPLVSDFVDYNYRKQEQ